MADNYKMELTLGHSPDPDDAFMFYGMAVGEVDMRGYKFEHVIEDIQSLNERATRGELHVTAVSIHAYAYILNRYALLPSGASMGDGYGPLLVCREGEGPAPHHDDEIVKWIRNHRIAVPGKMTSAFLALKLFAGEFPSGIVAFDSIPQAVKDRDFDAGLLIHEGQLTYGDFGLCKVLDLGEWWKRVMDLPLPLGGNVIRKDLERDCRREVAAVIADSIDYGLKHRREAVEHSMAYARGMGTDLADRFIGMYVNDFTRDYGELGRRAIHEFLGAASEQGFIPAPVELEFVE